MKTFLLELNEFNEDLLKKAGDHLHLKNIQKLNHFYKSETWTEDTYESDFLEPWVQWVSVHTGIPSSQHHIKHLGDTPEMTFPQLWEKLSNDNITSGIWGAMNAKRSSANHCEFFFPDLWTSSENAYPDDLNSLLKPLRYISKNYTSYSTRALGKLIKNLLTLIKKNKLLKDFVQEIILLAKNTLLHRGKPFIFVSFLDYLSSCFFLAYQKKFNPTFSLLFLNSLAHLQHHQWTHKTKISPPLIHGLKNIDKILGKIFSFFSSNDLLIVTNALSQTNTTDEKAWVLYRQIDQKKFLKLIGIQNVTVEEHMTHDAHLFFPTVQDKEKALKILESAKIQKRSLFYIELYSDNPLKLFYRMQFTDSLSKNAVITISNKTYRFYDLFKVIVTRTGKHIPRGTLLCNQPLFPNRLANHEIEKEIVKICTQNCQRNDPVIPQSR